ncbi:uncharacterized protein LOC144342330 [Saccoglossus kowalevskii]
MYDTSGFKLLRFYLATKKKSMSVETVGEAQSVNLKKSPDETGVEMAEPLCEDFEMLQSDTAVACTSTGVTKEDHRTPVLDNLEHYQVDSELPGPSTGRTKVEEALYDDDDDDDSINSGIVRFCCDDVLLQGSLSNFNDTISNLDNTETMHELEIPHPGGIRMIVIHRSKILEDMLKEFSDPGILAEDIDIRLVLPDSSAMEQAVGSGVIRECFTAFWMEFYERCTIENIYRVPFLRHDFTRSSWEAVGRIIVKGFYLAKYFPTALAQPFIMEVFLKAISDFNAVDEEDLTDALDNHQCRKLPSADNMREIILEIAHKEIIQEPMSVADCWRKILLPLSSTICSDNINKFYEDKKPNPKKVIKQLQFPDQMNTEEKIVGNHLQRYIREIDGSLLKSFLRFITGSDLMPEDPLNISFVKLSGICRRPVAHTCSNLLELPSSYDNYPDFRAEFNTILNAGVWVMDII